MSNDERQKQLVQLFATVIVGAVTVAALLLIAAFVVIVWRAVL